MPKLVKPKRGPKHGSHYKPVDQRLLCGRRLSCLLLPDSYARLRSEARRRNTTLSALVRGYILECLAKAG